MRLDSFSIKGPIFVMIPGALRSSQRLVGSGKLWIASTFPGSVWAPCWSKMKPKKLNLWLFDAALVTVELQAKSGSCAHEVVKVSVMFLPRFAVDSNIICNADDT